MAAALHHTISEYFISNEKDTIAESAVGSSVLLTPENTPTKESQCSSTGSELQSKDLSDEYLQESVDPNHSNKSALSRSRSDSRLDSPAPTQSKLTRSEVDSHCTSHSKLLSTKHGHGKGRSGRSKKDCNKSKSVTAKLQTGTVKETKQDNKNSVKSNPKSSRSQSVPAARTGSNTVNTLLTDYFPVRRSSRMPSSEVKKQQQEDLEKKILSGCEDGLKVVQIEGKGRGVIATKEFLRGDFVVEYKGDLLDAASAKKREAKYTENPDFGCYMYYFNFRDKRYCVDATKETDKLGRLLNHSKLNGNCVTKVIGIGSKPYLILVAARDIQVGEELLYDYGDRSKEAIEAHPWLAL